MKITALFIHFSTFQSMRCTLILLTSFLCFALSSFAQEPDYRDTSKVDFPTFRNEVFVNISPVAVILMGGENLKPRWSLGFQRQLQPQLGLRIWANYKVWEGIYEDKSDGRVVATGPGTFDIKTRDYLDYSLDLRAGLTFSKPEQRITAVYGFDLFGGLRNRKFLDLRTPYELDTAFCSNCYVPSTLEYPSSESSEEQYIFVGLDFSIGCLFKASDRVWVSLQWIPQLSYSSLLDQTRSNPDYKSGETVDGLNFNMQGIELFCSFRF